LRCELELSLNDALSAAELSALPKEGEAWATRMPCASRWGN